jgi:nucleoside-diphosphate-sugar epimerase
MRVAIAGAHGKIALSLAARLAARGDAVTGLIRNPDHAEDVRAAGADPVVCDLEHATVQEIATAIAGTEAVVFAAGAGPGSGSERKLTVDRDGAIKLLQAATEAGAGRYLIVSSIGAENPPGDDDVFSVYLRAKAEADAALIASDEDWTIVRPGPLTDDPGTGHVRIDTEPFRDRVSRDDVAAVFEALLHDVPASRKILYLGGGQDPIGEAIERVGAAASD